MPVTNLDCIDLFVGAVPYQSDTTQRFPLGLIMSVADNGLTNNTLRCGGWYQYCQGSNVSAIGQWVQIQGNSAVVLDAGNSQSRFPIGVAVAPMSATNVYGFVQIYGVCDYALTTNEDHTMGNPLYINAGTSGLVQSTPAAGNLIEGAVVAAAFSSSAGTAAGATQTGMSVHLRLPHVLGSSAAV